MINFYINLGKGLPKRPMIYFLP